MSCSSLTIDEEIICCHRQYELCFPQSNPICDSPSSLLLKEKLLRVFFCLYSFIMQLSAVNMSEIPAQQKVAERQKQDTADKLVFRTTAFPLCLYMYEHHHIYSSRNVFISLYYISFHLINLHMSLDLYYRYITD